MLHRDPSLTIPLCVSSDAEEIATAWQVWSEIFALPQLQDESREPAPRRRRRNAIRFRRPKFLMRRRVGALLNPANSYRGEREIIAGIDGFVRGLAKRTHPRRKWVHFATTRMRSHRAPRPANSNSPASRLDLNSRRHNAGSPICSG